MDFHPARRQDFAIVVAHTLLLLCSKHLRNLVAAEWWYLAEDNASHERVRQARYALLVDLPIPFWHVGHHPFATTRMGKSPVSHTRAPNDRSGSLPLLRDGLRGERLLDCGR